MTSFPDEPTLRSRVKMASGEFWNCVVTVVVTGEEELVEDILVSYLSGIRSVPREPAKSICAFFPLTSMIHVWVPVEGAPRSYMSHCPSGDHEGLSAAMQLVVVSSSACVFAGVQVVRVVRAPP